MSENIRVYADYTGCGVSSPELREASANLVLSQALYGNPHSAHALGLQSNADINSAKGAMLTYFDGWDQYECLFTAGATASLRVAQEMFASAPIRADIAPLFEQFYKRKERREAKRKQQQQSSPQKGGKKNNNNKDSAASSETGAAPQEDLIAACTRLAHDPRNDKYRQRLAYYCHWAGHTSLIGIRAHHQVVKFRGYKHAGDVVRRFPQPTSGTSNDNTTAAFDAADASNAVPFTEVTEFPSLMELLAEDYDTLKAWKAKQESIKNDDDVDEDDDDTANLPPTSIIVTCPLECNFSGARLPLGQVTKMISEAQERFGDLLDIKFVMDGAAAGAKVPLRLDGSDVDAICVSLYKMAGLPFGVGALIVKKSHLERKLEQRLLHNGRDYYGGGTVEALAMTSEFVSLHPGGHAWEDGTPNIGALQVVPAALRQVGLVEHSINSVADGLAFQKNDIWENISEGALKREKLRRRLKWGLQGLKHHNGMNVVHILEGLFNDQDGSRRQLDEANTKPEAWWPHQGAVVSFIVRTDTGLPVGHQLVERLALSHGICLRTGCFCNTGSCQVFLGISDKSMRNYLKDGNICGGPVDLIDDGLRPRGAVRLSLGWTSTEKEVDEIIAWARACFCFAAPPKAPKPSAATTTTSATSEGQQQDEGDELFELSNQRRARIKRMWVYPVKGLAGTEVASWRLDPVAGTLLLDRRFAIVDRLTGHPVQPKQNERLADIAAILRVEEGVMILRAKTRDFDPLVISFPDDLLQDPTLLDRCIPTASSAVSTYTKLQIQKKSSSGAVQHPIKEYEPKVTIRGHKVGTKLMCFSEDVDVWLSAVLRQGVRLIMTTNIPSENASTSDSDKPATTSMSKKDGATFANRDQSVLIISSSAHDEVERHTPEELRPEVNVVKYRANLYVDVLYNAQSDVKRQQQFTKDLVMHRHQRSASISADAAGSSTNGESPVSNNGSTLESFTSEGLFPEQNWKKITAPYAKFESCGPCHRCEQINVDPVTGKIQSQPLAALVSIAAARSREAAANGNATPAHLEDGVAQRRGGVTYAPTLGQLFHAEPTSARADVLKNIEAAANLLGPRGAAYLAKNKFTNSTEQLDSIGDSSSPTRTAQLLINANTANKINTVSAWNLRGSYWTVERQIARAYGSQIGSSMILAAVAAFLFFYRKMKAVAEVSQKALEMINLDAFAITAPKVGTGAGGANSVISNIFQSKKIVASVLSLIVSFLVGYIEIKLIKLYNEAQQRAKLAKAEVSVLDKMQRYPGSIAVGDILIVE